MPSAPFVIPHEARDPWRHKGRPLRRNSPQCNRIPRLHSRQGGKVDVSPPRRRFRRGQAVYQIPASRRADATYFRPRGAILSREADHRLALRKARRKFRRDDGPAGRNPCSAREGFLPQPTRSCPRPGLERHDPKISLPPHRRQPHRVGPYPGLAGALRRDVRSPDALRLHPGRLRLRLQVLRERARRFHA